MNQKNGSRIEDYTVKFRHISARQKYLGITAHSTIAYLAKI